MIALASDRLENCANILAVRPLLPYAIAGLLLVCVAVGQAQAPALRQVAGSDFTFIVKADGAVLGYGRDDGSLSAMRPPGTGIVTPIALTFADKVKQIAAGSDMQYALLEDGTVHGWGKNDRGQFGRGPGSSRTPENPMASERAMGIALPKDIVQIAAAGHYALAVRANGSVLAWGEHPASTSLSDVAIKAVPGLADVVSVTAGGDHALALTKAGVVFAWGENKNGQLGVSPETVRRSRTPVQVEGLDSVVSIACAGSSNFGFSGAVKADGTVWMWGSNQSATMGEASFWGNNGPPGNVNATPKQVQGIAGARSIAVGNGHVAVLLGDRTLRMWGHDGWGQIGVGTNGFYHPVPKKPAITDVAAVYLVSNRTYAVKTDGTLWWWGASPVDRPGSPLAANQKVPTPVLLP